MKKYSQEVVDFIEANVKGCWYSELAELTNEKMGTKFTASALRSFCKNRGWSNGCKGWPKPKLFSPEIEEYIRSIAEGNSYKGIQEAVNTKFATNVSIEQIKGWMCRYHVTTGTKGYFEKGHVPQNKGKKMSPEVYAKCAKTMFKKGNIPFNHRPVGTERVDTEGYIYIKVAEPNVWELKHRVVWEKHNGPIPKDKIVVFLDQNKQNCEIDNLRLCDRKLSTIMNHRRFWSNDAEITNLGLNICTLETVIKDKKGRKVR